MLLTTNFEKNLIKDANCDNRRYYDYEIEDYVIKDLISMSLDESKFRHNMNMNDINVSQARIDRIAQIDKQVVNLLDYISEGIAEKKLKKNKKITRRKRKNSKGIVWWKSKRKKKWKFKGSNIWFEYSLENNDFWRTKKYSVRSNW